MSAFYSFYNSSVDIDEERRLRDRIEARVEALEDTTRGSRTLQRGR